MKTILVNDVEVRVNPGFPFTIRLAVETARTLIAGPPIGRLTFLRRMFIIWVIIHLEW